MIQETDHEDSDLNDSSLAEMEVDSGSSLEMDGNKKLKNSDDVQVSQKSHEVSDESFIEDAIEIISATSPDLRNHFS